jgi:hypothetical protein
MIIRPLLCELEGGKGGTPAMPLFPYSLVGVIEFPFKVFYWMVVDWNN